MLHGSHPVATMEATLSMWWWSRGAGWHYREKQPALMRFVKPVRFSRCQKYFASRPIHRVVSTHLVGHGFEILWESLRYTNRFTSKGKSVQKCIIRFKSIQICMFSTFQHLVIIGGSSNTSFSAASQPLWPWMHCEEDGRGGSYLVMEPWCLVCPQQIFTSSQKTSLIVDNKPYSIFC